MKTSSCKAKGRNLQNLIMNDLREKYKEKLELGDITATIMGMSGTDINLSPLAKTLIPWDIECKNQENWSIPQWWNQTINNTEKGRKPLLVIKKNRQEPLVVLRWKDFKGLL